MKIEISFAPDLQPVSKSVVRSKHSLASESAVSDVFARVARGLSVGDEQRQRFVDALASGFVPGGRIMKGAGRPLAMNLANCFVQPIADTIHGSINGVPGIFRAAEMAAETLRCGGGVGYDFSGIRPKGAEVKGNGARASGPIAYMKVFGGISATVKAEDDRLPAQMAVLRVDHPDIYEFVNAKRAIDFTALGLPEDQVTVARALMNANPEFARRLNALNSQLSSFNLSVGISNEFMQAVKIDADFDLVHEIPPCSGAVSAKMVKGKPMYVYRTIRARDLWDTILWNTYTAAEPGVLFIDQINKMNNLRYIEQIAACNPCGEQMLPAHGACDVGSWNLSRFVLNPFTPEASFNYDGFIAAVADSVELLDRVLDVTKWPHAEQRSEAMAKRRIGLGFFGLADTFAMLGLRYGSLGSIRVAHRITRSMAHAAYKASIELAKKFGAFPMFSAEEYLAPGTFASTLPRHLQDEIRAHGIRNSHLLSVAPTGTIALGFGNNASTGCEPIFALSQKRYLQGSDGRRKLVDLDNAAFLYAKHAGVSIDPHVWATVADLTVDDHLNILRVVARNIDSAVSKTVNIPESYSYEAFKHVYMRAFDHGLKGLTTYRPNTTTGSVIFSADEKANCQECEAGLCDIQGKSLSMAG